MDGNFEPGNYICSKLDHWVNRDTIEFYQVIKNRAVADSQNKS